MLVILFLVAVLFAIPTYGLSLLAYFGFVIIAGILKAKARMHYANTQGAYRDVQAALSAVPARAVPTRKVNPGNVDEYWDGVVRWADRNGVPALYTNSIVVHPEFAQMFKVFLDGLESRGSSFTEQQLAGAEFIQKAWERMSDDQQRTVWQAVRRGVTSIDLEEVL